MRVAAMASAFRNMARANAHFFDISASAWSQASTDGFQTTDWFASQVQQYHSTMSRRLNGAQNHLKHNDQTVSKTGFTEETPSRRNYCMSGICRLSLYYLYRDSAPRQHLANTFQFLAFTFKHQWSLPETELPQGTSLSITVSRSKRFFNYLLII